MTPTEIKTRLIKLAIERHGEIRPCGFSETLLDGFGLDADERLVFWFNVGRNTHAIREGEIER